MTINQCNEFWNTEVLSLGGFFDYAIVLSELLVITK